MPDLRAGDRNCSNDQYEINPGFEMIACPNGILPICWKVRAR